MRGRSHAVALGLLCSPLLVAVGLATQAAAETVAYDVPVAGSLADAARRLIASEAETFGGTNPALEVVGVTPTRGGAVIRLVQRVAGLRVIDAGVAVTAMADRLVAASGHLVAAIGLAAEPGLTRQAAAAQLRRQLPDATVRAATLAVRAVGRVVAERVWLFTVARTQPFDVQRVVLRARDGQLLWHQSRLQSAAGYAYGTNPTVSKLGQVTLVGLDDSGTLSGVYANAMSCTRSSQGTQCERHAVADGEGNFLIQPDEPSTEDGFAEVQAYYHTDTFHRWLETTFGFARPGASQRIDVLVNYSVARDDGNAFGIYNAFYGDTNGDGRGDITFGQGHLRDFAYDADVIYHEFVHSVVDATSNLTPSFDGHGLNLMPAGLNEGFADLLSSMYAGDGKVGEYAGSGAIRDLDGAALSCPDDLSGESHRDGEIWGRAVWAARAQLSSTEAFDQIVYKTLVGLHPGAGFDDAAALLLHLAKATDAEAGVGTIAGVVQGELGARGLFGCSRLVPLAPDGTEREGYIFGTRTIGVNAVPSGLQYVIDVPRNAASLQLEVVATGHGRWKPDLGLFIRRDRAVDFSQPRNPMFDLRMSNRQRQLTLTTADGKTPLIAGARYYLVPVNVGRASGLYRLRATLAEAPAADASLPSPVDAGSRSDAGPTTSTPDAGNGSPDAMMPPAGCSFSNTLACAEPWAAACLLLSVIGCLGRRRGRGGQLN